VHRQFTGGVSMQWTVLARTCRRTYYWHLVKRMPICTCAPKVFVQARMGSCVFHMGGVWI